MTAIDEMTVFAEVAQAGGFTAAAQRLGLTPSGVSKKIKSYEERLGARLFNRTTRAVSMTEAGRLLFARSADILASVENAEQEIGRISAAPEGVLRVAASDALSVHVIVPFLKSFSKEYDKLSVILIHGDGGVDMLREGVDLALTFTRPAEGSLVFRKLIDDPWIVCAAPDYLRNRKAPAKPGDLADHKCLTIHARGISHNRWDFDHRRKRLSLPVTPSFSGIGLTVREAVLQGMGVARLAHFLVHDDIQAGRLVELLKPYRPDDDRALYIAYPHREHLPPKTRVFIDALSDHINANLTPPER